MRRRSLLAIMVAAAALAAMPATAQSLQERLLSQLAAQGYREFDVGRTLLGRVRIVAEGGNQRREIIFNPRTGEILRDYWQVLGGPGSEGGGGLLSSGGNKGRGGGGGGDDDDDDGGDDDDDGGNGGSGGGGDDD